MKSGFGAAGGSPGLSQGTRIRPPVPSRVGAALEWLCPRRRTLVLQLGATVIVLGWVPGNDVKLVLMAIVWALGFGALSLAELATVVAMNLLFVAMDEGALRQGIFVFHHPNAIGLPVYEFFMWGFYILHTVRFLAGSKPNPPRIGWAVILAVAFALCFSTIRNPSALAVTAGTVLAVSLVRFHEPMDFAYTFYMAAMGALVEFIGVGTDQWSYPHAPYGGVPLWSFAMWAGIGLFSRRLLAPYLLRRSS